MNEEKVFVSSPINCLVEERNVVKRCLYEKGYYPIMSEKDNFGYSPNDVDSHDYCINELLKCKQMVCIIGKKKGGEYAGNDYREYIDKIRKESNGKIDKPSISLMEFYVGRENGLKYRIFVEKEVLDQKEVYRNDKDNYNGPVDVEVFTLVDFINHIKTDGKRKGNWFMNFDSKERLRHQICSIDFVK